MIIVKLYVYTNPESENGISVKKVNQIDAHFSDDKYIGNGIKIAVKDFEKPTKPLYVSVKKLHYEIWTTEANSKESINKCIVEIIKDFEKNEINWNLIKDAVSKAKSSLNN